MAQIGNIPEILAVKARMEELRQTGIIEKWEIPYEHILTRLSAAIFFLNPGRDTPVEIIWKELGGKYPLKARLNEEKKLSQLAWRVEFITEPA